MIGVTLTIAVIKARNKRSRCRILTPMPYRPNHCLKFHKGDAMNSRKIGRRKFIQGASSAVLGLAAAPFLKVNPCFAGTEKGSHS